MAAISIDIFETFMICFNYVMNFKVLCQTILKLSSLLHLTHPFPTQVFANYIRL